MHAGLEDEPGRAEHGLRGERHGGGAVEPHLDAAVGERLDHDGDIARAGARQPGDGIQVVLVEHDDAPHRPEQRLGDLEVARLEALRARDGRRALEDEGRRVRHDADQACGLGEMRAQRAGRDARGERDDELRPVDGGRDLAQHRRHDLRLDREDDHVRLGDEGGIVRERADAVLPRHLIEAIRARVGGADRCRGDQSRLGQALDHGLAHIAGSEEADPLALDGHGPARGARGPKMAVPTRTIVAPSSTATA